MWLVCVYFVPLILIFLVLEMQWCVLVPVVLTLVANQDEGDKIGSALANYCYPKWALEAFVIANAQR